MLKEFAGVLTQSPVTLRYRHSFTRTLLDMWGLFPWRPLVIVEQKKAICLRALLTFHFDKSWFYLTLTVIFKRPLKIITLPFRRRPEQLLQQQTKHTRARFNVTLPYVILLLNVVVTLASFIKGAYSRKLVVCLFLRQFHKETEYNPMFPEQWRDLCGPP